jgi:hypothetical protein
MFQVTTLTAFSYQIQCLDQATYPEAMAGGSLPTRTLGASRADSSRTGQSPEAGHSRSH